MNKAPVTLSYVFRISGIVGLPRDVYPDRAEVVSRDVKAESWPDHSSHGHGVGQMVSEMNSRHLYKIKQRDKNNPPFWLYFLLQERNNSFGKKNCNNMLEVFLKKSPICLFSLAKSWDERRRRSRGSVKSLSLRDEKSPPPFDERRGISGRAAGKNGILHRLRAKHSQQGTYACEEAKIVSKN